MKKKKILAVTLAMALMVVGCESKKENTETDTVEKSAINSEYINLTMVKPKTINPIINQDKSVGYIMNLIYDGLFTIDKNYNVVPQLVDEYTISNDGMSISLKLKDAKWHNGESITSEDIKFTVDLINSNSESPYKVFTENISSVKILNNKEVNIIFKQKYPFSIETLIFPIVSESELGNIKASDINNDNKNLVGNGPYKIEKYGSREGLTLSVNENYYDELSSNTKEIKVKIVPDEEAQVAMVMALDSDIARVSLDDLSQFYEKEFNITKYEGRDYESVIFNYDNKFFKDANFRKAVVHAIDRNKILEEGYIGNAKLINFPLNSKSKYYNDDISQLKFDKEKAKSYLEKVNPIEEQENKNNKENKDNKNLENSNKNSEEKENKNTEDAAKKEAEEKAKEIKRMITSLNLKILVNKDNSERVKSANIISDNLKAIGIKSTIVELTGKDLDNAFAKKEYDLALVGWELSSVPDSRNILSSIGYEDEQLNNYVESLLNAKSQSQVKDVYKSIQKYVNDNALLVSLVIRNDYMVTNRRLKGNIIPNDFDVYEGIINLNIENNKK